MIGFLNAYRFEQNAPQYQLDYGPMAMDFLKRTFPEHAVSMYEVALGHKPTRPEECDVWVISGSPKSAYDKDPWILELGEFVRECYMAKRKLIGICFGHQLIAHYLGGKIEQAKSGWGVGVRTFRVLAQKPWMQPNLKGVSLLFSHQDQVVKLPTGAVLLGEDESCPIAMYSIGENIFCLQGHPEFSVAFARERLESRKNLVGQAKYDQAAKSFSQKTHALELGQWLNHWQKV